jgi:hypothetical protein
MHWKNLKVHRNLSFGGGKIEFYGTRRCAWIKENLEGLFQVTLIRSW